MNQTKLLIGLSDELVTVLGELCTREGLPRGPAVESLLWGSKKVREVAKEIQVDRPPRPPDGRGKWKR